MKANLSAARDRTAPIRRTVPRPAWRPSTHNAPYEWRAGAACRSCAIRSRQRSAAAISGTPAPGQCCGSSSRGVPIAPDPSVFLFMRGIAARQAARASRSPAGQTSVRSRTSRALSSFSERVRMSVFDFMSYGLSTGNGGMFLTDQQIFFLRRASRIFCTAWPRCTSRVLTEI